MVPSEINIFPPGVLPAAYHTPAISCRKGRKSSGISCFFRIFLLPVVYCLLPFAAFSQPPSLQTLVDKNEILIGQQLKLKIKAIYPPGSFAFCRIMIPDSIPHFDVLEKGVADTVNYKDNSKAIEQTILVTSFDSGKWTIPAFPVSFGQAADDTSTRLYTDSVSVDVSYAPADSSNQPRDIKPIIQVHITDYTWYFIGGGILLLLLAAFLVWRYIKNRKKKPEELVLSQLSPFDEAMQELKKLEQLDLHNAAEIKIYHTRLTGILKRYLGRRQNRNLDNRTTGDILVGMAGTGFSSGNISELATALRCSDAVKFAKYLPGSIESAECLEKIKDTINLAEQQPADNKT